MCEYISQIIYTKYKDFFACTNISINRWYKFNNHKWSSVNSAHITQELLSDDIYKMIQCGEDSKHLRNNDQFINNIVK